MDDPNEERDEAGLTPAERRILQTKAERADELEARVAAAELKLALRDEGLELNQDQIDALTAVHKGDRSAEAIRSTAERLGMATPKPAAPDVPAAEVAAHQRVVAAAASGTVGPPPQVSPGDSLLAMKQKIMRMGTAQLDVAMPAALQAIRDAGLNLDSVEFGNPQRDADWGSTTP